MRMENFNVTELIDSLSGTCTSIEDHLPEGMTLDDLTTVDTDTIDSQIFQCANCGWWCEIGEAEENDSGEDICTDCVG